ncbi:MAG TPA: MerR family transcriptional regulator [Nocardia sp.]|uniref:MerR family transcriptional regulator n=1 Tax=Nocardia TaxID=1817 RepID=UPI00245881F4|nr:MULTISPECIES: MerR family transcriptional regulator [Nocardia]HLS79378.1 MerR family transcriptional regulator [Nocardia sp.]
MPSRYSTPLRTVDVARASGYSAEQVRKLVRSGVLPAAHRTPSGHRRYRRWHLDCALAYRALAAGVGPAKAARLVRIAHAGDEAELLALLDAAHAGLDAERHTLAAARAAVAAIDAEPIEPVLPGDAMTVSELAGALGVRPSTLRHWDAEGLVMPGRTAPGGARSYSPADVRDARITHQLRRAGYRIDALRPLLADLRARRGDVLSALASRDEGIRRRSRALLTAGAHLDAVLAQRDPRPPAPASDR